jgi:hypothetical protein
MANIESKWTLKRLILRFFRNFGLTLLMLSPIIGFLLVHETIMATAPMDKRPWVHWNGLDPSNQAYITWETSAKSGSKIEYGLNSNTFNLSQTNITVGQLHRFLLTDLISDTQYYYRVSIDDGNSWYASGTFRTAPSPMTSKSFSFVISSDTQNDFGLGHYPRIAQAYAEIPDLAFVTYAGDMVQDHGQDSVLSPDNRQVPYNQFWYNTNKFTNKYPIAPNPGNHDEANAPISENMYQYYFGIPNPPNHNYYSFNWSRTQFIMAQIADGGDESNNNDSTRPTYKQDEWINATLEAGQSMDFRIMIFHRSLYASTGNEESMINRFMPILTKYNVSLLFYGHEHVYDRFYIENRTIICLGNGGSIMADHINEQPGSQASSINPGFAKVTCDSTGITVTTLTPTMNIMDSVRLEKVGSIVIPTIIK